jgi:DNA-binding GntR family transcriptional regulator
MSRSQKLTLKTLREQVYDYLRESLNQGELVPGATVDLARLSQQLGVSKTPLRFALFQLETEGFVTILPRRACVVNVLTLEEIRSIYQIIGALESSVILAEAKRLTPEVLERMRRFNELCRMALLEDDFDRYYEFNLHFHDQYLDLTLNEQLARHVETLKHRLYDFPRKRRFVKEWELRSTDEHEEFVRLLERGKTGAAADYMRDVHWGYDVQAPYIEQYYRDSIPDEERERLVVVDARPER